MKEHYTVREVLRWIISLRRVCPVRLHIRHTFIPERGIWREQTVNVEVLSRPARAA
jgi:hypothetical protein